MTIKPVLPLDPSRSDTKQRLLRTALSLFADQGINAVSMRAINAKAGARNASAAHYHFGSKLGVMEALIEEIMQQVQIIGEAALQQLSQSIIQGNQIELRKLLHALMLPYIRNFSEDPEFSTEVMKFFSRITIESNPEIRKIIYRYAMPYVTAVDWLIAQSIPHIPEKVRHIRMLFFFVNLTQGGASVEAMQDTPFGDMSMGNLDNMIEYFLDYVSAGLAAPVNTE